MNKKDVDEQPTTTSSLNLPYRIQASRYINKFLNSSRYWKMETMIILQQIATIKPGR